MPLSGKPAQPAFDDETEAALERGLGEFNRGLFFECHDTLEEVWQGTRGAARDFFQGLIQVSVGFYHLRNGNAAGAGSQLTKGLARLAPYEPCYAGVDLAMLREAVQPWLDALNRGELTAGTGPAVPQIRRSRGSACEES